MDKFSLVSIGISQASSIAFKKFFEEVEKGWNWLFDTVVKEAIEDTAKELSLGNPKQEEELKRALITWKKHESFSIVRKEIERASISGTVISADATANSLVSVEIIETSGISPDQLAACFVKHWVARAIAADKKYGNRVTAIGAQQVNAIPLEKSEILSSIPLIEMEKQNGEKTELEIRVDEAAKLLNAQKIESATILLKDIRREVSGKTDVLKSTLSRIATNLGVAYLRNELYDDAEAEFEAALEAEPNSSVTQINLAQVYYLRERPDAALSHSRTAYAMTPEDSQVIAAHLLILADNDWDSYQEFMTENLEFIESHSICQFALGQVEFERKENLPKAIQYFVNSKKLDETNVQCRFMLATTLLVQVQNELLTNTPSDGRVTEPERSNLLIALTELDWVVETAKEFDSKTSTVKALNNRACIKLLLEDYDAALSDCNLALFFAPKDINALMNKSKVLFQKNDYDGVKEIYANAEANDRKVLAHLVSEIYYLEEEYEQCRDLLEVALTHPNIQPLEVVIKGRLLGIESRLGNDKRFNELRKELTEKEDDTEALLFLAIQDRRDGNFDQAIEKLKKCLTKAHVVSINTYREELAYTYISCERFLSAIDEYILLIGEQHNHPLMKTVIELQWDLQNYFSAYMRAKAYREAGGEEWVKYSCYFEVGYLMANSSWEEAKEVLLLLRREETENQLFLLDLLGAECNLGNLTEARNLENEIDTTKLNQGAMEYYLNLKKKFLGE